MRNLCFTSLCFILSFYASVEHSAGSAAPDPPQQLTCNVTKNPDGSVTYQLVPAPTVNEYTSFSWAKNSITFADDGDKTADVLKLTKDSVTLKLCQGNVTYKLDGAHPQEASCHVDCSGHERTTPPADHLDCSGHVRTTPSDDHLDCSGHVRTTPSDDHRWCLSDDWCPPVVGAVVLVALVLVGALALVFYRKIHPRWLEPKTVSESH